MKMSTLQEKSQKPLRLKFTRFLVDRYKMNMMTAYGKMRQGNIHQWQEDGIEQCIREFAPEYGGAMNEFFENIPRGKTAFAQFMNDKKQMSLKTVFVRFAQFNFSEIELIGLRRAYSEFLQELQEETATNQAKAEEMRA